ncbi:hypothetical protein CsSME_00037783 [Camellia sinensis var. sinensis]
MAFERLPPTKESHIILTSGLTRESIYKSQNIVNATYVEKKDIMLAIARRKRRMSKG